MPILTERKVWRQKAPYRDPLGLTIEEQAGVRKAVRVLRLRYSSWGDLCVALGMPRKSLQRALQGKDRPVSPGLAIRAARLAGVPVDDVLKGLFPKAGECPTCGGTGGYKLSGL
jgi:hypothetical protein